MRMFASIAAALLSVMAVAGAPAAAAPSPLSARIAAVIARPALRHAIVGIEFRDLVTGRRIYALNADTLFAPASTTKTVTVGAALDALGPDFRFHTRAYRLGAIDAAGTLHGDLVLVASGDPDLSARQHPDDSLAFNDEDHSYGGDPVAGDALGPLRDIARQVAAHGIKTVDGHVLVDASLFPEGDTESGTGFVVSPACLNDNIVDVRVGPGAAPGQPAVVLATLPVTPYVTFVNQAKTGVARSPGTVAFASDSANADGSRTVTLTGSIAASGKPVWIQYGVPVPSAFLSAALRDVLRDNGIVSAPEAAAPIPPDFHALALQYTDANLVADHVSAPLSEEARVTLKVSQNLHAHMFPYLLGALLGHDSVHSNSAGLKIEHDWLARAGLDLTAAAQADGEGTAAFTPDFMTAYLSYVARQPWYQAFYRSLPVLGRDGTLAGIAQKTPAAGHVVGKTGTDELPDYLNRGILVSAKGLVGYFTTPSGRRVVFAIYINNLSVKNDAEVDSVAGQTVGELAAIGYESIR